MRSIVISTISGALAILSACGGSAPGVDRATTEDALSTRAEGFVTLRRDLRKCAHPLCGGYWITRANRDEPEQYVNGLDFSASGLDEATLAQVFEAPEEELVVRGRLGATEPEFSTRSLVVTEVYRALPGVTGEGEFFQVSVNDPPINCVAAPCPNGKAWHLNRLEDTTAIVGLSTENLSKAFLDTAWLVSRVERNGAIARGRIRPGQTFPAGTEMVLETTTVFLRLPETVGPCPMFKLAACPEGQVRTYTRNEDRCSMPSECVEPGACIQSIPVCGEGYTLMSWTAEPYACPAYACDPTFSLPPELAPSRCDTVRCAAGYHCVESGEEACVPNVTCAAVLCGPGTFCVETNGDAMCVPRPE